MTGSHLLLDICNINQCIATVADMEELTTLLCARFPLTVVGSAAHQFTPAGATLVLLLAESHLSIHTWPEESRLCFDLFCCAPRFDLADVVPIVLEWCGPSARATWQIVGRTGPALE